MLRHAGKTYSGSPALVDAALDLLPGEVHALMGENGAGKSTLIKILAGVVTPDSSPPMQLTISGRAVTLRSPADSFAHGLRFIHQELNIVPSLSVAENIFLGRRPPRRAAVLIDWRTLNADARAVLATLDIRHIDPRLKIARLSIGDQMLVKIASAFTGGTAAVYVMDEPTAALNVQETGRLFAVIAALKARDCAVLYVSHRMDEIFQMCDRVTVMRDGRMISTHAIHATTPAEVITQMTGRALSQIYPPRTAPPGTAITLSAHNLTTAHIRDITFDLRAGEILGIAGLAGAGKTELAQAVVGAVPRLGGTLTLNGLPQQRTSPAAAWAAGIAYVPEERRTQGVMLSRSIRDNITLPHLGTLSVGGALLSRPREERAARILGESVRLKARAVRQSVRELSGGNQQKVVFARSLAGGARVLVLDEPTRGVDVGAKVDIYGVLRALSDRGVSILMASSDLGELIGMCDRIVIVRNRRPVTILEAHGMSQEALLAACYGPDSHHLSEKK